jgi:DNA-binding NtrC family response regulator
VAVTLAEIEKKAIFAAIKRHGGDKVSAAKELGIGKTTIYRKLGEYERAAKKKAKKGKRR